MQFSINPALPLCAVAALAAPQYAGATVYLNIEQAQQILLPRAKLKPFPLVLSQNLLEQMRDRSGVRERYLPERIWHSAETGEFFLIDEVVGKHEMIKYALAISNKGEVRGVEIMEYNESYGYEIREAAWRQQFVGKTISSPVKLNNDIKNVSGATLSCKHVTDGVKRLLVLYELALQRYSSK